MFNFFKSSRFRITLCVLAALLAGVIAASVSADGTSPLTDAASVVFAPVQKLSAVIAEKTKDYFGSFVSSSVYRDKIAELQEQLAEKNEELVDYERTKQKLAAYEDFLEIKDEHADYEFCPASVVSRDSSDVYNSFMIDKGRSDGIRVNDPVIYGSYVIGIVKEVSVKSSVVDTILDPSVNISVYEIKTRESGYAATTSQLSFSGLCKMSGLTRSTAVSAGGIVCTSGLGGIFPRDLIVGNVTEVGNETNDVSAYAVIQPGVDIATVADVFVITAFEGQNEPPLPAAE